MAEMSKDDDDATSPAPLSSIVEAFEKLAKILDSQEQDGDLQLDTFCQACSLVSILFSCLGLAFKFAEMEYVSKVNDLSQAAVNYDTLENILDFDVANDTVKSPGSRSRNLRRVRQGLDLIRAIFENFLATDEDSLKEAASSAYAQVCAPYHTWAVRTAVAAGMYALPSRDQLLTNLKETHESAEIKMKQYIGAALPVIKYIDNLYLSRNIVLDW
ncbi:ACD11 homolog protein isoform X2 [Argentina anserina]|nr:ACD11 homolog protein isoform X2 [Potentilla anserina]